MQLEQVLAIVRDFSRNWKCVSSFGKNSGLPFPSVFSNVAAKFYFYPGPWLGRICPIGAFMIHKCLSITYTYRARRPALNRRCLMENTLGGQQRTIGFFPKLESIITYITHTTSSGCAILPLIAEAAATAGFAR